MSKIKYFIPILFSLAIAGCSSEPAQPKELTDEEYFSIMNEELDKLTAAWDTVEGPLKEFAEGRSSHEQMKEPSEKALAAYDKEIQKIKNIKPVPGWEERHGRVIENTTYFQEITREMLRTSKNGATDDLANKFIILYAYEEEYDGLRSRYEEAQ